TARPRRPPPPGPLGRCRRTGTTAPVYRSTSPGRAGRSPAPAQRRRKPHGRLRPGRHHHGPTPPAPAAQPAQGQGLPQLKAAQADDDNSHVKVAGLVTGRQRPGTASGVTFVTLEDEHGMINVVVWRTLAERQRKELVHS